MASTKFVSQAEFARIRNVSRKAVTGWKHRGLLVLNGDGLVDVEATASALDLRPATYRGGVTNRPLPVTPAPNAVARAAKPTQPVTDGEDDSSEPDSDNLSLAEAARRKENMLGLLRKHELEVARGEWVRVQLVGEQVEREYAVVRELLLTIPGKIATSLVGKERTAIEAAIRAAITEALHELHDPGGVADRADAAG